MANGCPVLAKKALASVKKHLKKKAASLKARMKEASPAQRRTLNARLRAVNDLSKSVAVFGFHG